MPIKNLGTVAGIYYGTTEPDNQRILWYDENTNVIKYYNVDSATWDAFSLSAGQIKLNSGDGLGYLEDKLDASLAVVSGELGIESSLLTKINGALQASSNLNDLANKSTARTNLSVYSIAQVDAFIGNRSYSEENNIVNGTNLTTAIDALDVAVGDRTYTYHYNIASSESVATSLGKIDVVLGNKTYTNQYVITNAESITASLNKLDTAFGNRAYSQNYNIADSESITASLEKIDLAIGSRLYTSNFNITDSESITASIEKLDTAIGNVSNYTNNNYITDGDHLAVAVSKLDLALYETDFGRGGAALNNVMKAYVVTQFSPRLETLLTGVSQVCYIKLGKMLYITGDIYFTTPGSSWLDQNEILIKVPISGGFPTATFITQTFHVDCSHGTDSYVASLGFCRIGGDYDAYSNELLITKNAGNYALATSYIVAFSAILFTSNDN